MYRKKVKRDKKKILIISLLIVFLIIGLVINIRFTDRNITVFEKAIKDSVLAIEKVVSYPFNFIAEKINENKEKNKMYDEYENMKKQLDEQFYLTVQLEELKKQIEELENVLEINNNLLDYETLNATVINRNIDYWQDTITIDKGEQDNITVGDPVIVKEGLIGKVVKTSSFNSTIRLLTSNALDKISVKIKNGDEYLYGILTSYDKKTDTYIIEGTSQSNKIEIGSIVTTTGMGDIFPSGIVLGEVVGTDTDVFDLSDVLQMKSNVNFDNINYVTVLKRNVR